MNQNGGEFYFMWVVLIQTYKAYYHTIPLIIHHKPTQPSLTTTSSSPLPSFKLKPLSILSPHPSQFLSPHTHTHTHIHTHTHTHTHTQTVFVAMSIYNPLRFSLTFCFPMALQFGAESFVTIAKIQVGDSMGK